MAAQVAVLRTRPETVVADYGRLMRLVKYEQLLPRDQELILKLNLSWTKYFPACSSQPWQVEGVLRALLDDGYDRGRIFPVENRTVVTNPVAGARNNITITTLAGPAVGTKLSVALVTAGTTAMNLASRESANKPQLILVVHP